MNRFVQDLRYALRQLRKSPGFTLVVVLMLALGIGANTAVFSVMNAVLMQLLPVSRPEGLSYVRMANGQWQPSSAGNTGDSNTSFSDPVFEALRQRSDVFEELIAYVPMAMSGKVAVRHGQLPEEAEGEMVSGNFFSGLGVRLTQGRPFSLDDEKNHAAVAVISYNYWTRSYARDPGILGQTLYVKGIPVTIVGVTAPGFKGIEPAVSTDFWMPLQNRPELDAWGAPTSADKPVNRLYSSPKWWCLRLMARLRPGISAMNAQQALQGTFGEVVRQTVGTVDLLKWKPLLDFSPARGIQGLNEQIRTPVRILMALVGMVLLIACTNVAMMIQARNLVRQREFSVRLAIGSGKIPIFRQLLCESCMLVGAGAALGWLFALIATRALASWSEIDTGMSPDRTVLLFTLGVSSLAAMIFGLVPLWAALNAPVAGVLRRTSKSVTSTRSHLVSGRIVLSAQVAVCLVLLMSAGLLLRTLRNYATQNLGIQADELLVFGVTPQGQGDTHAFYRGVLDRVRQLPGVVSVSLAENRPGSGWTNNGPLKIDGVELKGPSLRFNNIGPDFFQTMGIPVLAGRDTAISDAEGTQPIAIVNETFVRKYFANASPLGHHLGGGKVPSSIVGVVRDSKYNSVDDEPVPTAYYAGMQGSVLGTMNIEIRVHGDAHALLPVVRRTLAEAYPNVPLEQPMTQREQFDKSYAQQRMFAAMGGFFGVLAALLVATGLYGMHSFRVSRRTTEIGVRMALGATRSQVLLSVLRESVWILAIGLVVGVPLTWFAVRPLKSMLYQMSALDPASFAFAIAAIVVVSGCAAFIPARRAASIEPMQALRTE